VLERLDRLTQDEARTTAAQTLAVVHGLVQNMRGFMDGEKSTRFVARCLKYRFCPDEKASIDGIQGDLSTFYSQQQVRSVSHWALEMLHQMASEMNKSKRGLFPNVRITSCER